MTQKKTPPDARLHPYKDTIAASYLRQQVKAARFVDPCPFQVAKPYVALRQNLGSSTMRLTHLLLGEVFNVYEKHTHDTALWVWGQAEFDSYVGYVHSDFLTPTILQPTHRVTVLRTLIYDSPDIKSSVRMAPCMNSKLTVEKEIKAEKPFYKLAQGGYVFTHHCAPLTNKTEANKTANTDSLHSVRERFIKAAKLFEGTPYLWGGRCADGVDCSGLVQMAMEEAGIKVPRDADMQEKDIGFPLRKEEALQTGDLVFWKGHVAIMCDATTMLHASATHMTVVREPFLPACERIARTEGPITSIKRLGKSFG